MIARINISDDGPLDHEFMSDAEKSELLKKRAENKSTSETSKDLEDLVIVEEVLDENGSINHVNVKSNETKTEFENQIENLFSTCKEKAEVPEVSQPKTTSWLDTVEQLINDKILYWGGNVLCCPKDEEFFIGILNEISSKPLKHPLLSFKKNMANYLFRKLPSHNKQIKYTNELYNRDTPNNPQQLAELTKIVQERIRQQNEAKKERKRQGSSLNRFDEKRNKYEETAAEMNNVYGNQTNTFINEQIMNLLQQNLYRNGS